MLIADFRTGSLFADKGIVELSDHALGMLFYISI
jgi:hypothetical protein